MERPGKPRASSMEKSEIFLLVDVATYRHYPNDIVDYGFKMATTIPVINYK